jgi:3-oxoacyl-[acyl-carrier-protein] synthase-3
MEEALKSAGKNVEDLDMFIPHQANLRIAVCSAKVWFTG